MGDGRALAPARSDLSATALRNGPVLVEGGTGPAASQIWQPSTRRWTAAGSTGVARAGATVTLLQSGQVLVVGALPAGQVVVVVRGGTSSTELYRP